MATSAPHRRAAGSTIVRGARFDYLRYAQCWEDAAVLHAGLAVQPGDRCFSIASAGDNTLALLLDDPAEVIAIDLNPTQLAALQLRIAAYSTLTYEEFLELYGSRPSQRRTALYRRCCPLLSQADRARWDGQPNAIDRGIGDAGKFERYFRLFRTRVLPLVHPRRIVRQLLEPKSLAERARFYDEVWDTPRWRLLFRLFFSRTLMGRLGRDPAFFAYVEGDVAARILTRVRHALVNLDPAENPYLHWILTGTHGDALPVTLRREHFDTIRERLERITIVQTSLQAWLQTADSASIDRFNLSDCFEYCNIAETDQLYQELVRVGRAGGRLLYWNMLAPRRHPAALKTQIRDCAELSETLHRGDQAFFYSALHIGEFTGG